VRRTAVGMLLLFAVWIGNPADATAQEQTGTIAGVVTNQETGQPMPGVAIMVQGTRLAATANAEGRYVIGNVPTGTYRLQGLFLGYADADLEVTVVAGQTATANITMTRTVLSLAEVVATGVTQETAGTRAPFSIGRVSRENIATVPTTNSAVASIQGKVAGVSIVRGSGQPGTGVSVLLRSPTSIQGGSGPMYVIDGTIMATSIGGTTVDLESLDIESIEVVRGAAAASLYGSRAAGGVIAITTNRGRNLSLDQTRISARTEIGISQQPKTPALTTQHMFLQNEQGQWVDAEGNQVPRSQRVLGPTNMMDQRFTSPLYDNVSAFFRPARFAQNSVNLSHRAESTNFLFSANQYSEEGTLETNEGFTRNNFRINLDHRLRSDFQLRLSATHSRTDQDLLYGGVGNTFWDLLMYPTDVNLGVRTAEGGFIQLPDSTYLVENPLWYEDSREYSAKRSRTMASIEGDFNPVNWFTLRGTMTYDRSDRHVHAYTPVGTSTSITSENESVGYLSKSNEVGDVFSAALQGNLRRNFGDLTATTTGRALIERENNEFLSANASNFFVRDVPRLNVAETRNVSSSTTDVRSSGYFVEQRLDYANRYTIQALARRDGSSLFGENERWQNYWRVATAWFVSEENWFPYDQITLFKPRVAMGTAGGRPGFSAQYETWNVNNSGVVSKATLGNRDLRPEHTTELEIGLDVIVNDRYSLQLTRARQETRDQIIQLVLPAYFGYPNQWYNTGVQSGTTYELTFEAQMVNRPSFNWTSTLVADRSRSIIEEWNRSCFISGLRNICEGASLGDMWGERFLTDHAEIASRHSGAASQFQVNDDGYVVWVGEGNTWRDGLSQGLWGTSGTVDGETYRWGVPILDRDEGGFPILQQIGSSDPDFSVGWLNNVFWRGFAIHTHMHMQVGGNTYNGTKQRLYQHERHADLAQADKPEENRKTLTYYEAVYNFNNTTSHFTEPGSFLKLRSVSVQYRLNQDQLNRVGLGRFARGINLGVNGRNLLTFTDYSGSDPEVGSVLSRNDSFSYPNARQVTFTGEINF
jgi:TonB-linked SusC/RagA family outer membrane protein